MSSSAISRNAQPLGSGATAWGAVFIMATTSFALTTGEFLPPSLLPSMAASLGITQGQAGQAVTATAVAGLLMAPLIGTVAPGLDRRTLLSVLAVAATVSNLAVAVSGSLVLLLAARLLLGAAVGGFWAMSLSVAARVSAPQRVGRALTFVNMGGRSRLWREFRSAYGSGRCSTGERSSSWLLSPHWRSLSP